MLVFGRLERRKFQIPSIKNNAKDDAAGVIYIPLVCVGRSLPMHTLRTLYTHRGYLFACLYSIGFLRPQTTDKTKVQIPAFFVCSRETST